MRNMDNSVMFDQAFSDAVSGSDGETSAELPRSCQLVTAGQEIVLASDCQSNDPPELAPTSLRQP